VEGAIRVRGGYSHARGDGTSRAARLIVSAPIGPLGAALLVRYWHAGEAAAQDAPRGQGLSAGPRTQVEPLVAHHRTKLWLDLVSIVGRPEAWQAAHEPPGHFARVGVQVAW
jgi:hypothetical protein